jgi:hypothetical protein
MSSNEMASSSGAEAAPRSEWLGWALVVLLLLIGLAGVTLPSMQWFAAVPGDVGDARFNSVVLEHLFRVLKGEQSLWNPDFFYPFSGVLAFSDNHFGTGVTYILARLVGLSREHAFDVWYLCGVVANFAAATYALRRFGLTPAAVGVGAFIFTFGLPILAQDGHAQLIYRFGVPLAALGLWQAFEGRRILGLVSVVFWTTWQFYCSIYLGIFLLYLLAAMAAALWLQNRPFALQPFLANWRSASRRDKVIAGVIVALCGLAMTYLLGSYYLIVSRTYGFSRPIEEITSMLPRWASYFNNSRVPFLNGLTADLGIPVRGEQQMFVGFAAMALTAVGIVAVLLKRTELSSLGRTMFLALLFIAICTLWIRYFSFYYLIAWLPGVSSVRAVARVIVVMLFPIGLLAGIGTMVLSHRLALARPLLGAAVTAGIALLLLVEPLSARSSTSTIAKWSERLDAVKALIPADLPPDAILWVRTGSREAYQITVTDLDGMILAQDLGYPTLNGYSGYGPPHWPRTNACISPAEQLKVYTDFTGKDVSDLLRRVVTIDVSPCEPLVPPA